MSNTRTRGFTLIELLIVISIIGILTSFVVVNTSESRGQARDAERLHDLKQVQIALELYFNRNKDYPDHLSGERLEDIAGDINEYLSKVPNDPIPDRVGTDLAYRYAKNDTGYAMLARSDDDTVWCSVRNAGSTVWDDPDTYPPCPFY